MKNLNQLKSIVLLCSILLSFEAYARKVVATVQVVRGEVTKLSPGMMRAHKVKNGDRIVEDTSILAGEHSFIRMKFIDGSYINLGSNSKIVVVEISKKNEGVISLLKGKVRSKISKAVGKSKGKKINKFLMKIRNASVGVRGTDFMTVYNHKGNVTSLVVFEGQVAISRVENNMLIPKLEKRLIGALDRDDLSAILDHPNTKIVRKGRFSGVVPAYKHATVPVKISPAQFKLLSKNTVFDFKNKNPVTTSDVSIDDDDDEGLIQDPPPEGYFNKNTKEFAPRAGGFVDISSGFYIQPQADSKLDTKNKVYIISKEYGQTSSSGDYIPPKGLVIDQKKGFVFEDLDKKGELDAAIKVFGITKENLSPQEQERLRKSLRQVLLVKKAILNRAVKEDVLDAPLDDDEYIFEIEREFDKAKKGLKEVLMVNLSLDLGYDSNLTESLLGEAIKIADKSSYLSSLGLSVSHSSYLTNKWLVKPSLDFKVDYHPLPEDREVRDADKVSATLGLENLYNHGIGGIPSAFAVEAKVHRSTKMNSKHNTYLYPYQNDNADRHDEESLFLRYLYLSVGEKIYVTDYDTASFVLGLTNFDSFSEELNGQMISGDILYNKKIRPRYELDLGIGVDDRSTKLAAGGIRRIRAKAYLATHKIRENFTLLLGIDAFQVEFKDSFRSEENGKELLLKSTVQIEHTADGRVSYHGGYSYSKQSSNQTDREYRSHKVGVGMNYKF